jgi:hypothetical protein
MAVQRKVVVIEPDSEVARLLDVADESPLVLELNGAHYHLVRDPDELPTPRHRTSLREALRRSAGALANIDVEELKRDLREQREQNSIGRPG